MPCRQRAGTIENVSDLHTITDVRASAATAAQAAAERAGVEVRPLDSLREFEDASALIGRVWNDDDPKAPAALLRALSHAGNFVAGALANGELVGVSIGFFGREGDRLHLHSHITGVDTRFQNRSLGFALKQFQRSWTLDHGAETVRWTADPLVRRNLYFNLMKLGATVVSYHADFYGPMLDGMNAGESDRVVLNWELTSPRAIRAADGGLPAPEMPPATNGALRVWIPEDIVALRRTDPKQADAWRKKVRLALGSALGDGYCGDAITRDGWLLLTR
jgi:predicted GNAT superfamily acetyltransferase